MKKGPSDDFGEMEDCSLQRQFDIKKLAEVVTGMVSASGPLT